MRPAKEPSPRRRFGSTAGSSLAGFFGFDGRGFRFFDRIGFRRVVYVRCFDFGKRAWAAVPVRLQPALPVPESRRPAVPVRLSGAASADRAGAWLSWPVGRVGFRAAPIRPQVPATSWSAFRRGRLCASGWAIRPSPRRSPARPAERANRSPIPPVAFAQHGSQRRMVRPHGLSLERTGDASNAWRKYTMSTPEAGADGFVRAQPAASSTAPIKMVRVAIRFPTPSCRRST